MTGSGWGEIFFPKGYVCSSALGPDTGQDESCVLPTLFLPAQAPRRDRAPKPGPNALGVGDTWKARFCTSILQPLEVNNLQKVATLNFDDKI